MMERVQLSLSLSPAEPFGFRYFVPHSGAIAAFDGLNQALTQFLKNPAALLLVTVSGPVGSGKSHLIHAFGVRARQTGEAGRVRVFDFEDIPGDGELRTFVASYEELRVGGGLILVALPCAVDDERVSPHLASRLRTGYEYSLAYPDESELLPLLQSLTERHNLHLSEQSLNYLVKRLPCDPLSFDNIFAKISELSLKRLKPASLGVIREVVAQDKQEV